MLNKKSYLIYNYKNNFNFKTIILLLLIASIYEGLCLL